MVSVMVGVSDEVLTEYADLRARAAAHLRAVWYLS
jgi:hypothetical protein